MPKELINYLSVIKTPNVMGKASINFQFRCHENFDEMQPDAMGKFCDKCSKSVIDLNHNSSFKIEDGEQVCIAYRKNKLSHPLFIKRLASGVVIASTLLALQACEKTSINKTTPTTVQQNKDTLSIKGTVFSDIDKKPVSKVEVSLVQIGHTFTTKTDKKGQFELKIPKDKMEDKNVFRFTPSNTDLETKDQFFYKKDLGKPMEVFLNINEIILGEIVILEDEKEPMV